LAGVRVLIVEADPDVRGALLLALELNGAHVDAAASATECLERLARDLPDVLLTAVTPGEDGMALIRRLRSLTASRGGRIPAAALTGSAARHDVERILGAGYQMHLTTPVNASAVVAAVAKLAAEQISQRGTPLDA
jgi:CheY-like chemotaxis protein